MELANGVVIREQGRVKRGPTEVRFSYISPSFFLYDEYRWHANLEFYNLYASNMATHVRHELVWTLSQWGILRQLQEERTITKIICTCQQTWIGHILRHVKKSNWRKDGKQENMRKTKNNDSQPSDDQEQQPKMWTTERNGTNGTVPRRSASLENWTCPSWTEYRKTFQVSVQKYAKQNRVPVLVWDET